MDGLLFSTLLALTVLPAHCKLPVNLPYSLRDYTEAGEGAQAADQGGESHVQHHTKKLQIKKQPV